MHSSDGYAARVAAVREAARPLRGKPSDYDELMELVGDARFVLLGEATHGTQEFYQARAEITRRLITEKGFSAVAVEADWPDAYRVNRYVRGIGHDRDAEQSLDDFGRFPLWMWRNTEVLDFVAFLREFNRGRPRRAQAGFYGLDLYSLYASVDAVIHYLDKVDPQAARRARDAYGCLEHQDREARHYGRGVQLGLRASCEEQVLRQLLELRRNAAEYLKRNGMDAADELFQAQQNAHLVQNAERYYRAMFTGDENTWNLRDTHMADMLDALARHLSTEGRPARIVVWEHNSHIGDARATEMGRRGDHNVGQLVRQRHGEDCVLVGFTTYTGTVTAADDWDGPAQRKRVKPALEGSVEELFHDVRHERFFVRLRERAVAQILAEPYAERAIGVIYRPQTERMSHYFDSRLSQQFDAVFHFDHTRALEPLDATSEWARSEMPHTYPWGI